MAERMNLKAQEGQKRMSLIKLDREIVSLQYAARNLREVVEGENPASGPMARFKASWEKAKRDGKVECRFHDLRHTAISRMIDAGVPLPNVAKIVGCAPATMVRMAARYGHVNLESLRDAVETINRGEFSNFWICPRA